MKIHQTSSRVSENRWKWSISLEASPEKLDTVDKVIYHLHPTFPKPTVERTNRSENFEFTAHGWGTFVVQIEIHYKDGRVDKMRHRLVFARGKPKVFISFAEPETDPEIIQAVKNEAVHLGWDVSSTEEISPGDDWASSLNKQIDESQLFVLIGGETPSRGVMEEVETAQQLGKSILAYDTSDIYGMQDRQKALDGDGLVNAFKAYNFEMKGTE